MWITLFYFSTFYSDPRLISHVSPKYSAPVFSILSFGPSFVPKFNRRDDKVYDYQHEFVILDHQGASYTPENAYISYKEITDEEKVYKGSMGTRAKKSHWLADRKIRTF